MKKTILFVIVIVSVVLSSCRLSSSDKALAKTHLELILKRSLYLAKSLDEVYEYGLNMEEVRDSIPIPGFSDVDRDRILAFIIADTDQKNWRWIISNDFKEFLSTIGFEFIGGGDSYCGGTCTPIYLRHKDGVLSFTLWIFVDTKREAIITIHPFDKKG